VSRIAEMAREEIARTPQGDESDEDTTETPEGDEEEEAAELEPAASGPTDADLKRLERENTRHERELGKIIGEAFAGFEACEPCGGVGFVPKGHASGLELQQDTHTERCSTCAGYGATLTGAREPGQHMRPCVDCSGLGWRTLTEHPGAQPFPNGVPATASQPQQPPPPNYQPPDGFMLIPIPPPQ
jgi:hypothetical protein